MELDKLINDNLDKFSCNVTYYRKLRKMSQEQLSEKANLSRTILSNIEAPGMDSNPTLSTIISLAYALEIPAYKLLEFRD